MSQPHGEGRSTVPLFPLPNVVLFPRAVLPLHIFEERYKTMTADVLAGDRRIAMALLKPGWEKDYYHLPEIEPVVCIGEILTWEKLPDGNYNFLLQGQRRARIVREIGGLSYRVAELAALQEEPALDIDLERERQRLAELFSRGPLAMLPTSGQFQELLEGPLPTADIADLVAFNLLDDTQLKQMLLGETNVRRRVDQVVDALQVFASHFNPALHGFPVDPGAN
ncbi:MAG TPA: LON peptidase substrate-binding domain-containing protein [Tepidisphaeraceae bacterium]|nr:LON peptidase substrate-binding domain-containing protein [Tepidisphaeraceae bacterium]